MTGVLTDYPSIQISLVGYEEPWRTNSQRNLLNILQSWTVAFILVSHKQLSTQANPVLDLFEIKSVFVNRRCSKRPYLCSVKSHGLGGRVAQLVPVQLRSSRLVLHLSVFDITIVLPEESKLKINIILYLLEINKF